MKNINLGFVKLLAVTIMLLVNVMASWAQTKYYAYDLAGPNGPDVSLNAVAIAIATAETKFEIETNGTKYSYNPEMTKETFDALYKLALDIQKDLDNGVSVDTIINNLIRSLPNYNSWNWREGLRGNYNEARNSIRNKWDKTGQHKK